MTGHQLLELAGRCGVMKEIGLNETVSFTTPGVEKFKTLPLDQTEGAR